MAEREYEYGKLIPVPEDQQEYIFDPEMRELLATGDAIQAYPASMETDRVGLPTALARGAADLFDTSRREVVMPAETKLGAATEFFNPITNEFESRADETIRPGVFMRPEEPSTGAEARANMPLARGFSQAVDFAGDLITSPKARAQAIETLQGVPQMLTDQAKLSGIASLRGERVIDPDTGMTGNPYDAFLSATTPLAVGRAVSDVPRASFGIFGSGSGKSGKQAEDTVAMLEESGLDPSEGWERQDGANTYKAYRSSLDGKVRYEIPTANVAFRGVFRETEDPDVELGKLLDPETRDQQRLEAMQGLRIRINRYNDKEYIHVPGFSDLDETQLNKHGFTKLDSKVGKDGLTKFPAPVLEQIVDFPELFDEYPQLRSIQIKPTPSLALFLKGAYNPDTKEISLASVPNTAEGRKEMMSTLLHEMQHAVQDIEGLYGGANTRMFEPTGFAERQTKNQNARKEVDKEIGDSLDNLVVTLGDSASKKPKTGLFGKIFGLSSPTLPPRTQTGLAGADEERVRFVKRATIGYLRARAEEEEQLAAGELTVGERSRRELEDAITRRQQQLRDLGASEDEIADVEAEYRGQAFRYGGSDREMIYLADELKKAGVKNSEKVAERIGNAFDEQIQKLRPILKEKEQIEEISSRSYEMYAGNPGEVEARNVQRRFEGIEEGEYLRHPSGELRPFTDKVPPAGMQTLDPEVTQGMVLPEGGLVYSLAEGRKGQPSFSMDPPSNGDLDAKRAKLQQQRSIYDNRNSQLFENTSKPLTKSTAERLRAEREKAGREMYRLQHEIDLEENEPNLPDSVITRDSAGNFLPRDDFYRANEYAFHGTRGAADKIMKDGGVHMDTEEPAFFMSESPAEAMTYGAGGLGDLGTVIPMRIDTRGFAEIDYGGMRYGDLDEGGPVLVSFPSKTTFFGIQGTDFEVAVDFDPNTYPNEFVSIAREGGEKYRISDELLEQYHPDGLSILSEESLLNAAKDAGAPGARLLSFKDLNPTGATMLRSTTKMKIPEENEILTVFDKSRQRLAKGNPLSPDNSIQINRARDPFSGFANGGMVNNMKPRVTQGLTNLLNKYNASGPLAGAGNVPRGTMPVQMNQGGDPELEGFPAAPVVDPVQFPQPVFSTAPALPPEAALPPSVYTPPAQTAVTVPTQPMFTTPLSVGPTPGNFDEEVDDSNFVFTYGKDRLGRPVMSASPPENVDPNQFVSVEDFERGLTSSQPRDPYAVPTAPAPGMLSDAVVDFDISDQITPQTEGYATTRDMNIPATGDPFADAVEGEYQMPIYKPQVMPGSMPFMSVRYGRPGTPSEQPPEPPRSDQYSTGSFGRANYAEALSNWERMYGPVEDYQAPDPDAVMEDNGGADTGTTPGTTVPGTTTPGGTAFYPEPPPVRGSGGIGPRTIYNARLLAWEQKYGPVEDYYAAQRAAQNNDINVYLSRQGEEAVAAQYGYTVEQLRLINEDRRKLGLGPLGDLIGDINVNPGNIGAF